VALLTGKYKMVWTTATIPAYNDVSRRQCLQFGDEEDHEFGKDEAVVASARASYEAETKADCKGSLIRNRRIQNFASLKVGVSDPRAVSK
jgi:hypothetical protein